jgi:hypothetical protein
MTENRGEIILYQPDNTLQLEVRLDSETVWLTQAQMADLFLTTRNNVTMHISNIFKEGELEKEVVCKNFLLTTQHGAIAGKTQTKLTALYNLDVIISVGYRVKSPRGTQFRIWAREIIKDYLLRGYAINQRVAHLESRVTETEKKIDFFVKTALPPAEGIFFDGQIFDAYKFVSDLIETAKKEIVIIDNYVNTSVLNLLSKRKNGVKATVYTKEISVTLQQDIDRYNAQYENVEVKAFTKSHDRFLIIDNAIYHIGASLKDLGKKWFAFSKMIQNASELLKNIE